MFEFFFHNSRLCFYRPDYGLHNQILNPFKTTSKNAPNNKTPLHGY